MGLDGVRVIHTRISVPPNPGVLTVADLLGLRLHDLMRDGVLLVDLIILLKRVDTLLDSQIFGNRDIETSLLGIAISVAFCLELLLLEGHEDGDSLDDELIGEMESIMASHGLFSDLQVTVVEG